ncbi:MAG: hypothetical protein SWJ54_23175, partial [Cyanobacteriota bacterium]|nr:hypothetical protein [Cyanobacteriota bacterium]
QNQVQLFQASQYQISEVPLKDMPLSLEEALKYDDPEEQLQMHTGNPSPAQGQSLVYHGQGVGTTDNKDQIRRFLQKLDRGLHDILVDEQAPLVLAGVEFIMAMYREVTHYPNVLEEGITGNPENTSPKELHEQAWKIVHPCFQASQSKAETEYKELMGNQPEKVSHDLEEVIKAAHNQRIDSLFVTLDEQIWGKFNSQTQEITLQRENQSGNEDLLDFAVIHTYLNGGAVYTGDPETLPERTLISAILRY